MRCPHRRLFLPGDTSGVRLMRLLLRITLFLQFRHFLRSRPRLPLNCGNLELAHRKTFLLFFMAALSLAGMFDLGLYLTSAGERCRPHCRSASGWRKRCANLRSVFRGRRTAACPTFCPNY